MPTGVEFDGTPLPKALASADARSKRSRTERLPTPACRTSRSSRNSSWKRTLAKRFDMRPKPANLCRECGVQIYWARVCRTCQKSRARRSYTKAMTKCGLATRSAILRGLLPPPTLFDCQDCGCRAKCYDHRDYSKPLEVEPVCWKCNTKRGPTSLYWELGLRGILPKTVSSSHACSSRALLQDSVGLAGASGPRLFLITTTTNN
jgi:hypothetical protein